MEMQASVKDNVIIVSNDLVYDEDGKVTGFSEPLITSSNKGCLQHEFAAVSSKLKVSKGHSQLLNIARLEVIVVDKAPVSYGAVHVGNLFLFQFCFIKDCHLVLYSRTSKLRNPQETRVFKSLKFLYL